MRTLSALPVLDGDEEFNLIMLQLDGHTCVGRARCRWLYSLAKSSLSIEGDAAEIGVWRGGTAKLISKVMEDCDKIVHLFDTFEGMPDCDPKKDLHKHGDFGGITLSEVEIFLRDCRNVALYPGLFPETAESIGERRFCLVHVDADIYQSTKDACEFFYPRMSAGGVMIFDDYGSPTCPGAKVAVDEFFSDKPENKLCRLIGSQHAIVKN